MELVTICSVIQTIVAFAGFWLNVFCGIIAILGPTIQKQMYSYFIAVINIVTVIHCYTLIFTSPGYISDHEEAIVYVTATIDFGRNASKLFLLVNLFTADFTMQVYALFFGCRLATALIRILKPRKQLTRAGIHLSKVTLGLFIWTSIYIYTYGVTHWDAPFASVEYETSNYTYLRYDVNVTISGWIEHVVLRYYQWSMYISIVLVVLIRFFLSYLLVPHSGTLQSITKQSRTLYVMRKQALITFLFLCPIDVLKFCYLNNPTAETLIYTMRCLYVVIVPLYNWKIPHWREALLENPLSCREFCCPPSPAPVEIPMIEL